MSGKEGGKKRASREEEVPEEPKFADGMAGMTSAGTRSLGRMHIGGGAAAAEGGGGAGAIEEEEDDEEDEEDEEDEDEEGEEGEGEEEEEEEEEDEMEEEEEEAQARVFRPGVDALGKDETLEMDPSAYVLYHPATCEWPCLSLDIVPDRLGPSRTRFPLSATFVAGSTADHPSRNRLYVVRMGNLHKTQKASREEDEDEESSDEEEDGGASKAPRLSHVAIAHAGGVNKTRVMPQDPHIVATWADTGKVHLWDIRSALDVLDSDVPPGEGGSSSSSSSSSSAASSASGTAFNSSMQPVKSWGSGPEGWALDWSHASPGRLVSGDMGGKIHVWDADAGAASAAMGGGSGGSGGSSSSSSSSSATASSGFRSVWSVDAGSSFAGHGKASVEDLAWSPTEGGVFASCGCDSAVKIWDTRVRTSAQLSLVAHPGVDVNVLAWSRLVTYLLVSGGDDGGFKIWDLRNFKADAPIAHFSWHRKAITSLEWSPDDENILAVASEDNTVTLWDMSLEEDAEAEAALQGKSAPPAAPGGGGGDAIPAQLLFVHAGQNEMREARFHPQLPGCLLSTAGDGFNVWKPDVTTTH